MNLICHAQCRKFARANSPGRQLDRVVVGRVVHRLRDREHEQPRGVGVHHRLADVVLDRRVVGDAQADVDVPLARRLALADVDRAHRDPVPARAGPDQEPRVDRLVVGGGAVALGTDDLIAGDLDVVDLDRPGLVAPQPERVPGRGLRLDVLAVDHEHRQVVVAGEVGAGRLDDVEVGEPARGRPRRLLADVVAAVRALGAGGDRVPEVRAGLGVASRTASRSCRCSAAGCTCRSAPRSARSMIVLTAPMCIT